MQKRNAVLLATFIVLFSLATGNKPATAALGKPQPPLLPIEKEIKKAREELNVLRRLLVRVTAYYGPRKGQKMYALGSLKKDIRMNGAGKETRAGTVPDIGTAAADWRIFRKGTRFRIPNCDKLIGPPPGKPVKDIIFTVLDTGGGVKGKHVDIFTGVGDDGCRIARNFDCQKYLIEVVE